MRTIYVPDPGKDTEIDPTDEFVDFESEENPYDTKFPYALPWLASLTPNDFDTRKMKFLYSPECQKAFDAAYRKFDEQWKKTHPSE